MKKRVGILLGCLVLVLFGFVEVKNAGNKRSASDNHASSTEPSSSSIMNNNSTVNSSSYAEDISFIEGYYWDGYFDHREKIQDSMEEEEYKRALFASYIPDVIHGSGYLWYRLDGVNVEVPDGSYVKITYSGPVLQTYPAIFSNVLEVEVVE
ncbi:hypothetical protein [Enterococcus pallens]|uniref:hypothetical protein n=1 Tax=Enterococcus pallens TaxID=160454 RepID=UPI001114CDA7|nr:hypothetical protein [Enterococcus pallens]